MKLWLLRHARVILPQGICYGASDVVADPEATEIAASGFASLPAAGSVVWTSPLSRAHDLAQALCQKRADLPAPALDPRLQEMNFGCWELQAWEEIPRSAFDAWTSDFSGHRFGGKESAQDMISRVASALDDLLASGHQQAVWVTHAGVIRALIFLKTGKKEIQSAAEWPVAAPAPGEAMLLDF